jgi:hypothetical protein
MSNEVLLSFSLLSGITMARVYRPMLEKLSVGLISPYAKADVRKTTTRRNLQRINVLNPTKMMPAAWAVVLAIVVMPASPQTTTQKPAITTADLRFAAASVKPVAWKSGQYHGGSCHGIDSHYRQEVSTRPVPPGRCVFQNAGLGHIIRFAYQERERPALIISGGENWVWSEAFEVEAAAEDAGTVEDQLRLMLQQLLRERFKFQFHDEVH